jgi:hypothetical protein
MNTPTAVCRFTAIAMLASTPMAVTIAESNAASATGAFVNRGEMINWLADGERGLWIQVRSYNWFYARFTGACQGVHSTNSLVFNTSASGNIDRTSSVTLPAGEQCRLRSLAPSVGPPEDRNAHIVLQPDPG